MTIVKKLVGATTIFKNNVRMMKNGITIVVKGVATPTKNGPKLFLTNSFKILIWLGVKK
jgi:hypothetical protein